MINLLYLHLLAGTLGDSKRIGLQTSCKNASLEIPKTLQGKTLVAVGDTFCTPFVLEKKMS